MSKIIQSIGDKIIIPSHKLWMGLEDHFPARKLYPRLSKKSILMPGSLNPSASPSGGVTPDILDEKFEAAPGYDKVWSETVGAGCTINEDKTRTDVTGAPTSWGDDCLEIIHPNDTSVENYTAHFPAGTNAITYVRINIIFSAWDTDAGMWLQEIAQCNDSATKRPWMLFLHRNAGNVYQFLLAYYTNNIDAIAITNYDIFTGPLAVNTPYRVEIKYDITNTTFEWKVDGVSQGSVGLTGTLPVGMYRITLGACHSSYDKGLTAYYDNVGVDSNEWIGE